MYFVNDIDQDKNSKFGTDPMVISAIVAPRVADLWPVYGLSVLPICCVLCGSARVSVSGTADRQRTTFYDPYTSDRHLLLVSVHFGTILLKGTIHFSYKEAAALYLSICRLPRCAHLENCGPPVRNFV